MDMKRLLIPTDFSDNAGDALQYALNLVKGQPVELHIVHVVSPIALPGDMVMAASIPDNQELLKAEKAMEALESFSKLYFGDTDQAKLKLTTSVEIGGVAEALKLAAAEYGADAIIMGNQGDNHSLMDKVLGTISTDLINNAPCPVLLVPKGYEYKPIDNIIFSTNLNHSDPYELWKATKILGSKVKSIRCLYVTKAKAESDMEHLEEFGKYMTEHSPSVQTIFNVVEGDNVESIIAEYADTYNAEMIVMHRIKKSLWSSLFSISHTKRMVFWSKVPLMILN